MLSVVSRSLEGSTYIHFLIYIRSGSYSRESSPRFLTINADHAITINVSGLQEGGGLSVGQSSGTGAEVLQEKPEERKSREEPLSARRPGGQK